MDRIESKAAFSVDEEGRIEGLASVFGTTDRGGDIVHKGAFSGASFPIPMLAGHDQAEVIGVWEEGTETMEGLRVKGRLTLTVQRAREVRDLILAKALQGLSIGYVATRKAARRGGGRDLHAVDLLEISVVAVPMHPGARITSAKDMTMTDKTEDKDEGGIAALEAKMTDLEKKADTSALTARLDKLEAKMNRPATETKAEDEPTEERKAFAHYLRLGNQIPEAERKALIVASDPQGGYLAPPELSAEIIRDLVEISPIRQFASVRSTSAPSVLYPTRGDITNARWAGETQTRTESDISFGQKEMEPKELATFVDISNRLLADAPQAETEVRTALSEDFGQKEARAFVLGQGVLEPEGFMVHEGIASTANGHATTLSADALIGLLYALPATYRNRGAWAMNGTTLGKLRLLKDGDGRFLWQPSFQAGQPETILGRPVIEMVDMPDIAANAFPIIYGDFSAYRIIDRTSMSVLVDPYTRATNGITRIHATRRVGGGVLQAARFRKLRMATS
ncbi:phage major capsid protein [Paracoccus sp. TOH]|uniref:phage major capsid protein n=1 Tax=Paracoccus sp. TOH TaxID=1263728 RepID=UPI0025B08C5D|nr:phage major capsid protein [Paracoccus sp. TOH]WJS83550.1 phage major capsid protein [Paracoccus sp. TOH]